MQRKFLIAATVIAAAFPALAGTIATNTAPKMSRIARADNVATRSTTAGTGQSAIASDSTKQKNTPAVKPGGLLNTDVSPKQADAVTRDTNRKIARGEITPQRRPAPDAQEGK